MTGYTKGEWLVSENGIVCHDEPNEGPWYIATAHECVGENGSDTPYNARLISAAPDMYEALKFMLNMHLAHHNHPIHAAARAALAKAEGKA